MWSVYPIRGDGMRGVVLDMMRRYGVQVVRDAEG
jgi:hypothetical protein